MIKIFTLFVGRDFLLRGFLAEVLLREKLKISLLENFDVAEHFFEELFEYHTLILQAKL